MGVGAGASIFLGIKRFPRLGYDLNKHSVRLLCVVTIECSFYTFVKAEPVIKHM